MIFECICFKFLLTINTSNVTFHQTIPCYENTCTIHIENTNSLAEIDDYILETDGKYTMTYPLKCRRK